MHLTYQSNTNNFLVLVAWGVRESSYTNNIFTTLNLITVSTVIVTGFYAGIVHFDLRALIRYTLVRMYF